ncbi:MAG: prepilin-type N-terminal cleavage/methylation domain-containing protein, partial [Alcaligenaceae bacterium]
MNFHRCEPPVGIRGMTLVECLIAIAIAAVLMMVAVPGMSAYKRNAELTSTANRLLAAVNATRGEAMKRGVTAMLVPTGGGGDWNAGWTVFLDLDGKQVLRPDGLG